MLPLVAIIGRPNVGKSTLFNRLVGRRTALVADEPGMTRDRHYATVERDGRSFLLVDTGGFEPDASSGIEALIASQTRMAIEEADVILLLFDGRAGLTAADEEVVALLRRTVNRTVLYVVNKIDGPKQESLVGEFYSPGIKELWPVSAEHGLGFPELAEAVVAALTETPAKTVAADSGIRVALVGRPNSGKSALLNRLVGDERSIVSDMPGTTRDPVDARIESEHGRFTLVDTAGIRRRTKSGPALERLAALWSVRRIADAEVACLVIDAEQGPTIQDAKIANAAMEAGRAMVLVLSKSDLLAPPLGAARRRIQQQLEEKLGFATFAPWVLLSSVTGRGVKRLLPLVRKVRSSWETRIPTASLNRFLEQTTAEHPPPSFRGRPVNLMYIAQPQTCPPTLVIHANRIEGLSATYRRYLANRLRSTFNFEGTPVRLFLRQDAAKKARFKSKRSKKRGKRR